MCAAKSSYTPLRLPVELTHAHAPWTHYKQTAARLRHIWNPLHYTSCISNIWDLGLLCSVSDGLSSRIFKRIWLFWGVMLSLHKQIPDFKRSYCPVLYFVDRASCYKFLIITNLMCFFMYLFISSLYVFRASRRSSSGDRIVLIHHLVWLVCVSDYLVCLTGIPSSHLHRLIIPDDVLTQFDLPMMSTLMPETCREMI